jgi:predicted amidohydrolase
MNYTLFYTWIEILFNSIKIMKISLGQINIISGQLEVNINKVLDFIAQASKTGSDLIVFPEMCDTGYDMPMILKKASSWDEGMVPKLREAAVKYNINIVAGVSKRNGNGVYNGVVTINRTGDIIHEYFKTHLITAEPMLEHNYLKPGDKLGSVEIEGIKMGIITCYEIRFPEISRTLALNGAKVILILAAWPLVRLPHWQNLAIARAIENQIFIAGASRIGNDTGVQFAGSSMIIGPYGNLLSSGTEIHESLVTSDIDIKMIDTVRNQIKVYQDRRPELYKIT